MASPSGMALMSQPPMAMSVGSSMGRTLLKGTWKSSPVVASMPRRTVEASVTEPKKSVMGTWRGRACREGAQTGAR